MISRSIVCVVAIVVVAGAVLLTRDPEPDRRPSSTGDGGSHATVFGPSNVLFSSDYLRVWAQARGAGSFLDEVLLVTKEVVPYDYANATITFEPEVVPGTYVSERVESTSYAIQSMCSRTTTELYISGFPIIDSGPTLVPLQIDETVTIVERWTFTPRAGTPFTERSSSSVPLGTSAPLSSLIPKVQSGSYQIPDLRRPPRLNRRELARLPLSVYAIEVDPEGRYLLLLAPEQGGLYQLDLVDFTGTPELVVDSVTWPQVGSATSLLKARFQDGAKRYVLGSGDGALIIKDSENDAIFESVEVVDSVEWTTQYSDDSTWAENYRSYEIEGLFQ